jgi:hypothetical protein
MRLATFGLLLCAASLSACASSSVMDVNSNTIMISTSAAPACGAQGAQQVALRRAAIEALQRGYDKYIILDSRTQNNVGVVGYTPMTASTYSSGTLNTNGNMGTYSGTSNTSISGGQPIIAGSHNQQLEVRLFRSADPGAENAVDARKVLGPDWQQIAAKGPGSTC